MFIFVRWSRGISIFKTLETYADIKSKLESKISILTSVHSIILNIKAQNNKLLQTINKILFSSQSSFCDVYNVQLKLINLENKLNALILLYEEELLHKIRQFVNAKSLQKSVEVLRYEWCTNINLSSLPSVDGVKTTTDIEISNCHIQIFRISVNKRFAKWN